MHLLKQIKKRSMRAAISDFTISTKKSYIEMKMRLWNERIREGKKWRPLEILSGIAAEKQEIENPRLIRLTSANKSGTSEVELEIWATVSWFHTLSRIPE